MLMRMIHPHRFGTAALLLISAAVSLLLLSRATAQARQDDAFFPVMAWDMAPSDPAALRKMRDCGINIAGFAPIPALDAIHAAGMKAILTDPRTRDYDWADVDAAEARKNVQSLISEVKDHPAIYGYHLRDEPRAEWFEGLEKVASAVRELAPGKWPYINLFPNYADASQLGSASYEEYLDRFISTCKPPVLSYDHYALMDDGSVRAGYWQNLEQMRAAAKRAKIPFWNIVLAVAHFNYREVTPADFRLQAYSTLTYGGRGIAYFKYFTPDVGSYRAGPVDPFGHETPTWQALRSVNLQIAKLAPTLLKLSSDRVYHFGAIPQGCAAPDEQCLLTAAGTDNFMAGDFTHEGDGSRWVMIVNRDLAHSYPCNPVFRSPPKRLMKCSPVAGKLVPFEGEECWIAPGQGVLLKLVD
jgi:hypothetical protein